MNLCVSYLWFTFYYKYNFRNITTSPFVTIWHAFIIYIHSCYYICQGVFLHDPRCSKTWGNFWIFVWKKCQKLHFLTNFRKLWWSWERIHFIQFTKEEWKKKWCIKHDIVLCTTIWGEYSNVYFLVIFFIYQVVALFSLANDSYILLFKNDSYKSKHFIGKTFVYVCTINHIPFQF